MNISFQATPLTTIPGPHREPWSGKNVSTHLLSLRMTTKIFQLPDMILQSTHHPMHSIRQVMAAR
jgi:hypothetical protein